MSYRNYNRTFHLAVFLFSYWTFYSSVLLLNVPQHHVSLAAVVEMLSEHFSVSFIKTCKWFSSACWTPGAAVELWSTIKRLTCWEVKLSLSELHFFEEKQTLICVSALFLVGSVRSCHQYPSLSLLLSIYSRWPYDTSLVGSSPQTAESPQSSRENKVEGSLRDGGARWSIAALFLCGFSSPQIQMCHLFDLMLTPVSRDVSSVLGLRSSESETGSWKWRCEYKLTERKWSVFQVLDVLLVIIVSWFPHLRGKARVAVWKHSSLCFASGSASDPTGWRTSIEASTPQLKLTEMLMAVLCSQVCRHLSKDSSSCQTCLFLIRSSWTRCLCRWYICQLRKVYASSVKLSPPRPKSLFTGIHPIDFRSS